MSKKIRPDGLYRISKLWITRPEQVDKSLWTYAPGSPEYANNHGPRMLPDSRTGQMTIMMGMDARINHGTIRTGAAMVRFVTNLAAQVGLQDPKRTGTWYSYTWLNEGLIEEVQ